MGNKYNWTKHWWTRFFKFGIISFDLLFCEPSSKSAWHPTKGNIIDIRIGNEDLDERKSARGMIKKNKKHIKKALMDGLHDCEDTFNLCDKEGIEPGIKIRENACEGGFGPRPMEVKKYKKVFAESKDEGKKLASELKNDPRRKKSLKNDD